MGDQTKQAWKCPYICIKCNKRGTFGEREREKVKREWGKERERERERMRKREMRDREGFGILYSVTYYP